MPKNDVVVRTPQDLERKYNLGSLGGMKKNIEITAQGMQKIENELNSMLNALVINLKDVLDSQSEISLWFYSGKPTKANLPYTSWTNPNDHMGDIYYDQSSGAVYQYNGVWEVNVSPDLVEAMAITNSELDTTTDHERKVFFTTPTIPYSNGDWWVKEDGSLFICQISKASGVFENDDFISSNSYTESIAEKIENEIKVLKGTITTISDSFAKFTDLATGGSTTISGDNIITGVLKSENYIANTSGTKISLIDGSIDSKNFKVDSSGNVTMASASLTNGILKIGSNEIFNTSGVLSMFQYQCSGGEQDIGWYTADTINYTKKGLQIMYNIPNEFTVTNAYIVFTHIPCRTTVTDGTGTTTHTGYARNVKLYKLNSMASLIYTRSFLGGLPDYSSLPKTEISGALNYTGSASGSTSATTTNIASNLTKGSPQMLLIDTSDSSVSSLADAAQKTGMGTATLFVIGYYKI